MKIKQNVIDRVRKDLPLINKIVIEIGKDIPADKNRQGKDSQTVRKWLKEGSIMLTLYSVYATIQREYKLSDKEMFENK